MNNKKIIISLGFVWTVASQTSLGTSESSVGTLLTTPNNQVRLTLPALHNQVQHWDLRDTDGGKSAPQPMQNAQEADTSQRLLQQRRVLDNLRLRHTEVKSDPRNFDPELETRGSRATSELRLSNRGKRILADLDRKNAMQQSGSTILAFDYAHPSSRMHAVIIYPQGGDHNGAFLRPGPGLIGGLSLAHSIHFRRAAHVGEIVEQVEQLAKAHGPMSVVIIGGHGSFESLRLSENSRIDSSNYRGLNAIFDSEGRFTTKNAAVFMDSCSNGSVNSRKDNLIDLVSSIAPGRTVSGSVQPFSTSQLGFSSISPIAFRVDGDHEDLTYTSTRLADNDFSASFLHEAPEEAWSTDSPGHLNMDWFYDFTQGAWRQWNLQQDRNDFIKMKHRVRFISDFPHLYLKRDDYDYASAIEAVSALRVNGDGFAIANLNNSKHYGLANLDLSIRVNLVQYVGPTALGVTISETLKKSWLTWKLFNVRKIQIIPNSNGESVIPDLLAMDPEDLSHIDQIEIVTTVENAERPETTQSVAQLQQHLPKIVITSRQLRPLMDYLMAHSKSVDSSTAALFAALRKEGSNYVLVNPTFRQLLQVPDFRYAGLQVTGVEYLPSMPMTLNIDLQTSAFQNVRRLRLGGVGMLSMNLRPVAELIPASTIEEVEIIDLPSDTQHWDYANLRESITLLETNLQKKGGKLILR